MAPMNRQIIYCKTDPEDMPWVRHRIPSNAARLAGPFFNYNEITYFERSDSGNVLQKASLKIPRSARVDLYLTLTAFPNHGKEHYFHSSLLFEIKDQDSTFELESFNLEDDEAGQEPGSSDKSLEGKKVSSPRKSHGRLLVLDSHTGLIGISVGDSRLAMCQAMLNFEPDWLKRYDSFDIPVAQDLTMTNEMWQNLVFVMQETVKRKFDLPIHEPRVKWSILFKGVLAQRKSGSLEPYSNCGMFNIRVLKAIGIQKDPLEQVMPMRLRNVQRVLGYAVVKSLTAGYIDPSSSSIDQNMKSIILRDDNKEFLFLHPDFKDIIRHYKGPHGSYDYSNQTVIEVAVKSLRNWTLLIKSLWFAL